MSTQHSIFNQTAEVSRLLTSHLVALNSIERKKPHIVCSKNGISLLVSCSAYNDKLGMVRYALYKRTATRDIFIRAVNATNLQQTLHDVLREMYSEVTFLDAIMQSTTLRTT